MRAAVHLKSRGLFSPPKHKWLADIVTIEDPKKAERAAERLVAALENGKMQHNGKTLKIGKERALNILRAITLAENRANAATKRKNLSEKEKRELTRIARIYDRAKERAKKIYDEKYRGKSNERAKSRKKGKKG